VHLTADKRVPRRDDGDGPPIWQIDSMSVGLHAMLARTHDRWRSDAQEEPANGLIANRTSRSSYAVFHAVRGRAARCAVGASGYEADAVV
jgi:hypothetical protein